MTKDNKEGERWWGDDFLELPFTSTDRYSDKVETGTIRGKMSFKNAEIILLFIGQIESTSYTKGLKEGRLHGLEEAITVANLLTLQGRQSEILTSLQELRNKDLLTNK